MKAIDPPTFFPAHPEAKSQGDALLIHGIFDTSFVFRRMAKALSQAGWNVHTPTMRPSGGQMSLDALAAQISEFMEEKMVGQSADKPWLLLGFSMGGLVARALLQNHGVKHFPKALITLGSPHHGSLLTYFYWGKGTRDMRPTSQFIRNINAENNPLPTDLPCYSLWTPLDLMILPSFSSIWKRAQCEIFWAPLHPWLLINQRVIERVIEIGETKDHSKMSTAV